MFAGAMCIPTHYRLRTAPPGVATRGGSTRRRVHSTVWCGGTDACAAASKPTTQLQIPWPYAFYRQVNVTSLAYTSRHEYTFTMILNDSSKYTKGTTYYYQKEIYFLSKSVKFKTIFDISMTF